MKAKQAGFTLIELMFTIFVLAVLLGIGVPNFRDFVRNSRMTAAANDLLADLNFARSEAVKRRAPVTLCKSTDGESCDEDDDSEFLQWIVFLDNAGAPAVLDVDGVTVVTPAIIPGNGLVDDDELVLKNSAVSQSLEAGADGRLVVYRPSGFPDQGMDDTLSTVVLCDSRGNNASTGGVSAARALTVSPLGRAAVSRDKARIATLGGCPP